MKRNPRSATTQGDVHRLLADPERRAILAYLHRLATTSATATVPETGRTSRGSDPFPLHLDTLADRLVTADVPATVDTSSNDLRVRLHHVHLPMFDTFPGITYDPTSKRIEYAPTPVTERAVEICDEFTFSFE